MTNRFTDRTALVTGAGSGIGLATARRLVDEGARVVANDVSQTRLDALVAETAVDGEARVVAVVGDIATQEAVDALVAAAEGRVDVLANVAGIMDGVLPPHELDDATWELVLGVNLTGPMRLTRAVLPLMMEAGRGSIVNVASEASLRASSSGAAYTTSKHALIGLTRSTAVFYGQLGIRCNAVCPGAVKTNIGFDSRSAFGSEVVGRHITTIPTLAEPEEIAASICWLASDDASNVNGAVLAVDGGWSAA
jgi:NAD(P)-dependent dehydrogenase (short-subunit alcohol dehydrogenase family)